MRKFLIVAVLCAVTAGCSTQYGKMGLTGGVEAAPLTSDTYRISGRGNGFTASTTVQDYVLLKAAETTLQSGHTYFLVLGTEDASRQSTVNTPGTINSNVFGNTIYSTYTPGQSYDIVKPGEDLLIRVFTPPPGAALPPGAFPAQEVFDSISPRVKRSDG